MRANLHKHFLTGLLSGLLFFGHTLTIMAATPQGPAESPREEGPRVYVDYTEIENGSEKIVLEHTSIIGETEFEFQKGLAEFADQISIASNSERAMQVAISADNNEAGQNFIQKVYAAIPDKVKPGTVIQKITQGFKNSFNKVINIFKNGFTNVIENHEGKYRFFFAITRGYINAQVMSSIFHAGLQKGVTIPLGDQLLVNLPYLGEVGLIGDGPAWLAGLSAGIMSFLMTVVEYKKGAKKGINIFYSWLTTPGKFSSKILDRLLKKFIPKLTESQREAVILEVTSLGKWKAAEFIFAGIPALILLSFGFPLAATVWAGLAVLIGSTLGGVAAQYNLDSYLGRFQELASLKNEKGTPARAVSTFLFYLQMMAISVVATAATTLSMGASKATGYMIIATLFASGIFINRKITKKLQAYKELLKTNTCVEALKKPSDQKHGDTGASLKDTGS